MVKKKKQQQYFSETSEKLSLNAGVKYYRVRSKLSYFTEILRKFSLQEVDQQLVVIDFALGIPKRGNGISYTSTRLPRTPLGAICSFT